jgi:general secretion pathway protein M
MNKLKQWYAALEAREQRMVSIGAVVLCALLLFGGLLLPLEAAVSGAVRAREDRRQDMEWMRVNAPEVRAGGASLAPDTGEAPVVLVDRIGREAGLGSAMRGTQPSGSGVRVQLEAAPFDTLVNWLATLDERHGLAVESISVDRAARPGLVNANVTLTQSRH